MAESQAHGDAVGVVSIRTRADTDLDRCQELARRVHDLDGYPAHLPHDLRAFIATPGAIAAWVAEDMGEVVGHVALHPSSSTAVVTLASEVTGLQPGRLGVVARLFVSPDARGRGVGRALLRVAASGAVALGLRPILDVHTALTGAIALYEHCGWSRIGEADVKFRNGTTFKEFVYVAPARTGDSHDEQETADPAE